MISVLCRIVLILLSNLKICCQQPADMAAEGGSMRNVEVTKLQVVDNIKNALLEVGIKNTEVLVKRTVLDGLTSIKGIGLAEAKQLAYSLNREGIKWRLNNHELFVLAACYETERQRRVQARKFLETPLNESQKVRIWEFFQEIEEVHPKYSKILEDYYGLNVNEKKSSIQDLARRYDVLEARISQLVSKAMNYFRYVVLQASAMDGLNGYQVLLEAHLSEEQKVRERFCIAPPRDASFCEDCEYSYGCEEYDVLCKKSEDEVEVTEDSPLACLNLSYRSYMTLRRAGFESIGDLLATDLNHVRNLVRKSKAEIIKRLEVYGFLC